MVFRNGRGKFLKRQFFKLEKNPFSLLQEIDDGGVVVNRTMSFQSNPQNLGNANAICQSESQANLGSTSMTSQSKPQHLDSTDVTCQSTSEANLSNADVTCQSKPQNLDSANVISQSSFQTNQSNTNVTSHSKPQSLDNANGIRQSTSQGSGKTNLTCQSKPQSFGNVNKIMREIPSKLWLRSEPFPHRLHQMLIDVETYNQTHIIF